VIVDNHTIAQRLTHHAHTVEREQGNLYRARAYRRAAATVLSLDRPLEDILAAEGLRGLEALPGIGSHLAYTLEGLVRSGEFRTMGDEDGSTLPAHRLTSLPGVGPRLAQQIRDHLGITTLEDLQAAAHAGRLRQVGVGAKRLRGILDVLEVRLGRTAQPQAVDFE
jgi:DNA polymerase/3'-5' exonuclease PolX